MQEIVNVGAVGRLFTVLAVLLPVIGGALGILLRWRGRDHGYAWRMGMGLGVIGPVNWLLWRLYNELTDRNGLDTVRNFGVNLVVFVVIGLGIGVAIGAMQHRYRVVGQTESEPPDADATV